jgi:hypothetical protein
MEKKSSIIAIGLTIHNAPVELREKLAVPEAEWPRAIEELCSYPHIEEAAVLSTCNRMEIYVVGLSFHRGESAAGLPPGEQLAWVQQRRLLRRLLRPPAPAEGVGVQEALTALASSVQLGWQPGRLQCCAAARMPASLGRRAENPAAVPSAV